MSEENIFLHKTTRKIVQPLKKNIMKHTLFVLTASLFLLSACTQDPAPLKTEKEIAQEVSRTWDCKETGENMQLNFKIKLKEDPENPGQIIFENFHNTGNGSKIHATLNTALRLQIPEQQIDNQIIKGSGEIANDYTRIDIDYTLEDQLGEVNINAVLTYGTAPAK
ncbi:MAG: hypothetical protein CSB06_01290 [Bacteroidia bacterium]|nr:MAG: hypothetical protein CSB06_01290 [Bacteroidia bacterium]